MLRFATHIKPKIRKAAQHAVASIIHGCYFMAPRKSAASDDEHSGISNANRIVFHPAGSYVAKFCFEQFEAGNLVKSQTVVLHTLALLRDTLNGLKTDDIKDICERLLSIMTASKVMIQTNCFHIIHSLFASKTPNLTASLTAKLIAAVYDYRPERSDVRQTLAWLQVMKEGHICLASFDLTKCVTALPRFVEIVAGDIWMSGNNQIASGASNALKEILLDCVGPASVTEQSANMYRKPIVSTLNSIARSLSTPFGAVSQQVILLFETVFDVAGRWFKETLQGSLNAIAVRYDKEMSGRPQIERTLVAAIKAMGPEATLKAVPLRETSGTVNVAYSWILPLLREGINQSSFRYFYEHILPLANRCFDNWEQHRQEENMALARTNELLFCQLWGLFPGFCRDPIDVLEFGAIAPTLGDHLKKKIDTRLPILDGLCELLQNEDYEFKRQLGRYAKNFLNILLNIYVTKPSGSYENDIRTKVMEVIPAYLKVTPQKVLVELFAAAKSNFKSKERIEIILEKIQKLNQSLDRSAEKDRKYDASETARIQEAHDVLESLLRGENALGVEYVEENDQEIQIFLRVLPEKRVQQLFKKTRAHNGPFVYEACFDIVVCLALYQPSDQLKELFDEYIAPTMKNAKQGGITRSIKERQLKSYELLQNILLSENDGCQTFAAANVKEIHKLLLGTVLENKSNAKVMQLT